jgi:probable HAF family extracellular repeat protein
MLLAALWMSSGAAAQPLFRLIEPTPPPDYDYVETVWVNGVSADGRVVVGCATFRRASPTGSRTLAFSWTLGSGIQVLTDADDGVLRSCARAVSADGSVIVGDWTFDLIGSEAVRWINGAPEGMGDLQGGIPSSSATGVSHDGSVVVGGGFGEAFRWHDGAMFGLGNLDGGSWSSATAVSGDGRVVVGNGENASNATEAFRWEDDSMVGLGELQQGSRFSQANGISADGRVSAGVATGETGGREAFRWEDGVMSGLGCLRDCGSSYAYGVSGNGTIVVGASLSTAHGSEAFVWDAVNGMRSLEALLTDDLGLNLAGRRLTTASAITPDGLTVVGSTGNGRGFIARLGYPDAGDSDDDGIPNDRDVCPNTIGGVPVDSAGCPAIVPGDLDRDGDVDLMDYAIYQRCMSGPEEPAEAVCNAPP